MIDLTCIANTRPDLEITVKKLTGDDEIYAFRIHEADKFMPRIVVTLSPEQVLALRDSLLSLFPKEASDPRDYPGSISPTLNAGEDDDAPMPPPSPTAGSGWEAVEGDRERWGIA